MELNKMRHNPPADRHSHDQLEDCALKQIKAFEDQKNTGYLSRATKAPVSYLDSLQQIGNEESPLGQASSMIMEDSGFYELWSFNDVASNMLNDGESNGYSLTHTKAPVPCSNGQQQIGNGESLQCPRGSLAIEDTRFHQPWLFSDLASKTAYGAVLPALIDCQAGTFGFGAAHVINRQDARCIPPKQATCGPIFPPVPSSPIFATAGGSIGDRPVPTSSKTEMQSWQHPQQSPSNSDTETCSEISKSISQNSAHSQYDSSHDSPSQERTRAVHPSPSSVASLKTKRPYYNRELLTPLRQQLLQGSLPTATKQQVRQNKQREVHNLNELRRRSKIRGRIWELKRLLPKSRLEGKRSQKRGTDQTPFDLLHCVFDDFVPSQGDISGTENEVPTSASIHGHPSQGKILSAAVCWIEDLVWMIELKLRQDEMIMNTIAELGGQVSFAPTNDEVRLVSELRHTV